jgi:hypothetical protein
VSILASNWPAVTRSPTSTSTSLTRPVALNPSLLLVTAAAVPVVLTAALMVPRVALVVCCATTTEAGFIRW